MDNADDTDARMIMLSLPNHRSASPSMMAIMARTQTTAFTRTDHTPPQFHLLSASEQVVMRDLATTWRLTQQELRLICAMALDRVRWRETPLSELAECIAARRATNVTRDAKKAFLAQLQSHHAQLTRGDNEYADWTAVHKPKTRKPELIVKTQPQLGLGRCPVASPRTRCCNLMTLDAVEKCGFDCSYCSIQSFYHGNEVVFDRHFADKLARLKLDPEQTYHIGTGQASDSLMWGNHQGILHALWDFAAAHPNVILELKTKSKNIGWILDHPPPPNVLCTWSLNPQTIITHEEHRTASLEQRLVAAAAVAANGNLVGFHFHPIIHYRGWQDDYQQIGQRLVRDFSPEQVALVSLGTLTFTKAVMKTIRARPLATKILQLPLEPCAGKLSYPIATKIELFQQVYTALAAWHRQVFFYLCMEPPELWSPVFGFDYADNAAFETAMHTAYRAKIRAARARSLDHN